jgi:hypothetical protein
MFQYLLYFAFLLGLIPLAILKWRRSKVSIETSYIMPFAILVFAATLYEWIISKVLEFPTVAWFRIYLLLEFCTLSYYFYHLLKRKYKLFFAASLVLFVLMFIYLLPTINSKHNLRADSYLSVFTTVFIYISIVLWCRKIFKDPPARSLLDIPHFYFISGFIFYFSGTLFLYIMGDLLLYASSLSFENYWNLSIIFNIILRTFLIIGAWKMR